MARAVGIDISYYDISFNPTPFVEFVTMRASYGGQDGVTYQDKKFSEFYPASLSVPVRGVYHYMSSHGTWKTQANKFLEIIGGKLGNIDYIACDIESYYNTLGYPYLVMAFNWMDYIKEQTKKPVLLYTNPSVYNAYINRYADIKTRAAKYPFWIAQYYYNFSNYLTTTPRMPNGRSDWKIWQFIPGEWDKFGAQAGVGRAGVDTNVYNGTLQEMGAWLNTSLDTDDLPMPEVPPVQIYYVTTYSLNVRAKPTTSSSVVGGLFKGDTFRLFSTERDSFGNTWGNIGEGKYIALKYYGAYYTTWRA